MCDIPESMTKPRRTATQSGLTANTVHERQSSRIATFCLIAIYIIGLATENGIQESSAGKSSPNWVSQSYPDTFLKRCSLLWIKQEVWCYKTRTNHNPRYTKVNKVKPRGLQLHLKIWRPREVPYIVFLG